MQYHALSIAKHGGRVDLIGYHETAPHPSLSQYPNVKICPLDPPPSVLRSKSLPFLVSGPLKVIWQVVTLIRILGYDTPPAQWLLVQNPPSIPTLAVAAVMCRLRNTHLLIDWHNYGWTILAGTRGSSHPFVRISKLYECIFGRIAPTANLTVTNAMAKELRKPPYKILTPILTMHDRPAAIFQPVRTEHMREDLLQKLDVTKEAAKDISEGRLRLIVSSTSWTPDEDFSLMLDALVQYANADSAQTPVLAIITGRGPQRAMYEAEIKALREEGRLTGVIIKTAFLSFEDYASLLGCADLGICLHKSSSGVDLPMKVVDMFGAGLPVVAYSDYESFSELVREGDNGCGFETAEELEAALGRLLSPEGQTELKTLKQGAIEEGSRRWDEEWDAVVGPLLSMTEP
ncbi:putative chitobiosyldiphosphodolichol beta-mannosyltransferase protein [Phaeoacremonium minimum UCRPA7]|uniref:Chitobiosyldiphosphodolichol beta-mannosyltransferase n=1 Tax=Phaeoacremonium minimum (strain UCR-PA7) TaxID=1286976 RepID=R8BP86_PHAM7|nr:putative chitobiosyldiphosphodolichol beta-mannosyltransferase protein [Phaeoacremonium minimum UCRPA7]EOO01110.1 putative chitobiosyldiphosphodolichol beta-mannosyltransferase protein [Phaeoacremonium minimum UCRPA7]